MKVEKKQSRASVLDKAKKLAISKAVDQYAESYENKTGKTVNAEALKSIFIQHADVVEDVMTKGDFEKKIKTAVDTVDVVGKMARIQDLNGNVVQTKDLVKDKSALHVLFSPDSIDSRGDLKEEGKQAMQELVDAIKFSEEYIRYQDIKNRVHNQPQLEQQIHAFRHNNYLLQNSDGNVELYDATDKMEQEYREFRKNPLVAEYLAAENAFCRVVQKVNWTLIEELDFEVGFEE